MRHQYSYAMAAAIVSIALQAAPAEARMASDVYRDVPEGHWAERAVTLVAIDKKFMKGYPDNTFRGDLPFTRIQLALAIDELIRQLEAKTKASWATEGLGGYAFQDLPDAPEVRETVLRLANQYRLFEGVPGITSNTLESHKQVTRYEMAKVVHRLMRLGETRGVVDPSVQKSQIFTFSDVPRTAWSYNEVKEVSDRYQVMVGFPDATFRGPEELTRYQFAASAAQTFPLVVELVEKTQEKQKLDAQKEGTGLRFQEDLPVVVGVGAGLSNNVPGVSGMLRGAAYFGPVFVLAEGQTAAVGPAATRVFGGEVNLGYAIPLGSEWHLQPYLGARSFTTGADSVNGVSYGALTYWRPSQTWGTHLRVAGMSPLQGNAQGSFLGNVGAGLWWHATSNWGLFSEANFGQWPTTLGAPAGAAFASDWVPTLSVGAGYKF